MWTQLFNQFNCRKIVPVFNVFRNIREHMLFIYVWIFSAIVQVLMTQVCAPTGISMIHDPCPLRLTPPSPPLISLAGTL